MPWPRSRTRTNSSVIGSQAIPGQYPDAPDKLLVSKEADVYAPARPDLSDLIDGALGELSQFEATFGYRADGVGPGTATLPDGWKDRLIPIVNENWASSPTRRASFRRRSTVPSARHAIRTSGGSPTKPDAGSTPCGEGRANGRRRHDDRRSTGEGRRAIPVSIAVRIALRRLHLRGYRAPMRPPDRRPA